MFERGDGRAYGALDSPRAADACERVFRGLRGLGFGEREARRAIERVRGVGDTATLLRRALSLLTEQACIRERARRAHSRSAGAPPHAAPPRPPIPRS